MTTILVPSDLTFKLLRLLADGEFHSGEALAGVLGVSRTTVWKALQAAEPWGVTLYKVHGRGYRLVTPIEWLDAGVIARRLGPKARLFELRIEQVCASTNSALLCGAAAGVPSGTVLAAELQSAGRGRRGRSWYSMLGGALTFSLLWRFERGPAGLAGLSLAVSVGVLRALRELGLADVRVKWPNDVLWRYQKLAGILIEIEGSERPAAVIGIGANLRLDERVRSRVDQAATDLVSAGLRAGRNELLAALLSHQADVLQTFAHAGFAPLRDEWEQAHAFAGRQVVVALPDRSEYSGTVTGVAEDGALLVGRGRSARRFHSGDVSLRPQLAQSEQSAA
jgi:BirA family biotin operon repressor/biotin-[acetyl-CoA-carboxylase] ligase